MQTLSVFSWKGSEEIRVDQKIWLMLLRSRLEQSTWKVLTDWSLFEQFVESGLNLFREIIKEEIPDKDTSCAVKSTGWLEYAVKKVVIKTSIQVSVW